MSTTKCGRKENSQSFEGLCISYVDILRGLLRGCRPLFGFDGCFLKGKYDGARLVIVVCDGDNMMFLITIYISKRETLSLGRAF